MEMTEKTMRLNKYLSAAGVCSRREADRLIEAGRVSVDGQTASVGMVIETDCHVSVDGQPVSGVVKKDILLLVNKPMGIVCTAERQEKHNIIDFLDYPERIYPIGRLDKDSHGLILMTNVGSLHNEITRAANGHEKEYIVTVDKRIEADFVQKMAAGVYLPELGCKTMPAKVQKLSEKTFSIVLKEGKNRQIRRMCRALSYRTRDLKRIRIMHFRIDGIAEGQYRPATEAEWTMLKQAVKLKNV